MLLPKSEILIRIPYAIVPAPIPIESLSFLLLIRLGKPNDSTRVEYCRDRMDTKTLTDGKRAGRPCWLPEGIDQIWL